MRLLRVLRFVGGLLFTLVALLLLLIAAFYGGLTAPGWLVTTLSLVLGIGLLVGAVRNKPSRP